MNNGPDADDRTIIFQHAIHFEYLTVGWNLVEGVVAVLDTNT